MTDPESALLDMQGLTIRLKTPRGWLTVLDQVSLKVYAGQTLGLVGESGCGKSVTALAIMRLLPSRQTDYASGRIVFDGSDLLQLSEKTMRSLRGRRMAMIFQEPMTSLNPVLPVGEQVAESLRLHRGMDAASARAEVVRLLDLVGIPGAARRAGSYAHELSGGQRQRVMIAIALACQPRLLIADEPTTALDVTVQAQILRLLDDLRREFGMGMLLITHDLALVADHCDQVAVMYAGCMVEQRSSAGLFRRPWHPYTRALLETTPAQHAPGSVLPVIAGAVPPLGERGSECLFSSRCEMVSARCAAAPALLAPGPDGHARVACWHADAI